MSTEQNTHGASNTNSRPTNWQLAGNILTTALLSSLIYLCISAYSTFETYAAYKSSSFDSTISSPSPRQGQKEYTFILTGPHKIKENAVHELEESNTVFYSTSQKIPDKKTFEPDINTQTLAIDISKGTFKHTKSSTLQKNDDQNKSNDPIHAYRNLLHTKLIQSASHSVLLLIICISLTITIYFTITRAAIEKRYNIPDDDQHSIERLQQSLDRSILRYNTLGILLFCFTIVIVLISGTLTFSLFASTIDNIKDLEAAKDNVAVILLYIMRTSLLTAFLTTTIIVFYKFSKSAIDQSARFLKRKHATKFLKFLISKAEDTGTIRTISPDTISYFSGHFDLPKYLTGKHNDAINVSALPDLNKEIEKVRKAHGLPDIPHSDITPNDPLLKNTRKGHSLTIPLSQAITQRIIYPNINEILTNKIRLDDLEKLMRVFEVWNADIGSAFGDAPGKANNSTPISLNSLLKDEKK